MKWQNPFVNFNGMEVELEEIITIPNYEIKDNYELKEIIIIAPDDNGWKDICDILREVEIQRMKEYNKK